MSLEFSSSLGESEGGRERGEGEPGDGAVWIVKECME